MANVLRLQPSEHKGKFSNRSKESMVLLMLLILFAFNR